MSSEDDRTAPLTVWRWNADEGRHSLPVVVPAPCKVLTVRDLRTAIDRLVDIDPLYADLPVSLLDMGKDEGDDEAVEDNLLTDVETDVLWDEQGLVLSLISWPRKHRHTVDGEPT